jgi:RND family efflux transporter MFP subunit
LFRQEYALAGEILQTKKALVAIFSTLALVSCGDPEQQAKEPVVRPVKALKVADPAVLQGRWFSGRAEAVNQVELSFRVPGTLVEVPVKVGDTAKKGGLIAQLDPSTYQTRVDELKAEVLQAEAANENSRLQLERQEELLKKKVAAEAQVDRLKARFREDSARIEAAKAALRKSELDLQYTSLRAPFDGTIVATYVENFEDIRAKERVVRLLDPAQIEMVINIPETLITFMPQIADITVTFDVFPDVRVPAVVKELGSEASQTTRTYPVTLIVEQPENIKILPGMAGKATGRLKNANDLSKFIIVPPGALFKKDDKSSAVWVIDPDKKTVSSRDVEIDGPTGIGIKLKAGLKAKEWVVTAGVNSLEEGQKVRILSTPETQN